MRVVDLFCGAGGFSLGFERAGFEIVLAVDINEPRLRTYEQNHPDVMVWQEDILKLDETKLPKCDVLLGSTPCASFSLANKTERRTEDMALTNRFLQIVDRVKPRCWVLENVPPVALKLAWTRRPKTLNAADYGARQIRFRMFAGNYSIPELTHRSWPLARRGSQLIQGRLFSKPLQPWLPLRPILANDEPFLGRRDYPNRHGESYRSTSLPCWTLTGANRFFAISHIGEFRALTTKELGMIQGFPADYKWPNRTVAVRAVADAVNVETATAIAQAILRFTEPKHTEKPLAAPITEAAAV